MSACPQAKAVSVGVSVRVGLSQRRRRSLKVSERSSDTRAALPPSCSSSWGPPLSGHVSGSRGLFPRVLLS
ncbi:hypothetical protein NL676_034125 [Syzygium grande]|nr:hypothetical protein NL676_034125 [Syzygium grande]